MSKKKDVDVFVKPDSGEDSGYKFWMKENGQDKKILEFNKSKSGMKKNEDHKIVFRLRNTEGATLSFSKIRSKVLWAMEIADTNEVCPPEGSKFPGLYVDPTAFPQDDELVVINENKDTRFFSFALNFVPSGTVEESNTQYICYDPVGSNQNGGVRFESMLLVAALSGVFAGCVMTLGVQALT